ncbi:MAG: hypothetical protein MK052_07010 [Alphaproteobacteria bacterium]|nr:hypothetical protein [Alphaproteobacteria bacterium]
MNANDPHTKARQIAKLFADLSTTPQRNLPLKDDKDPDKIVTDILNLIGKDDNLYFAIKPGSTATPTPDVQTISKAEYNKHIKGRKNLLESQRKHAHVVCARIRFEELCEGVAEPQDHIKNVKHHLKQSGNTLNALTDKEKYPTVDAVEHAMEDAELLGHKVKAQKCYAMLSRGIPQDPETKKYIDPDKLYDDMHTSLKKAGLSLEDLGSDKATVGQKEVYLQAGLNLAHTTMARKYFEHMVKNSKDPDVKTAIDAEKCDQLITKHLKAANSNELALRPLNSTASLEEVVGLRRAAVARASIKQARKIFSQIPDSDNPDADITKMRELLAKNKATVQALFPKHDLTNDEIELEIASRKDEALQDANTAPTILRKQESIPTPAATPPVAPSSPVVEPAQPSIQSPPPAEEIAPPVASLPAASEIKPEVEYAETESEVPTPTPSAPDTQRPPAIPKPQLFAPLKEAEAEAKPQLTPFENIQRAKALFNELSHVPNTPHQEIANPHLLVDHIHDALDDAGADVSAIFSPAKESYKDKAIDDYAKKQHQETFDNAYKKASLIHAKYLYKELLHGVSNPDEHIKTIKKGLKVADKHITYLDNSKSSQDIPVIMERSRRLHNLPAARRLFKQLLNGDSNTPTESRNYIIRVLKEADVDFNMLGPIGATNSEGYKKTLYTSTRNNHIELARDHFKAIQNCDGDIENHNLAITWHLRYAKTDESSLFTPTKNSTKSDKKPDVKAMQEIRTNAVKTAYINIAQQEYEHLDESDNPLESKEKIYYCLHKAGVGLDVLLHEEEKSTEETAKEITNKTNFRMHELSRKAKKDGRVEKKKTTNFVDQLSKEASPPTSSGPTHEITMMERLLLKGDEYDENRGNSR